MGSGLVAPGSGTAVSADWSGAHLASDLGRQLRGEGRIDAREGHAGLFGALEDQLCGMLVGGTYEGPGRSPDRADALVWALTELMLGRRSEPSVRVL